MIEFSKKNNTIGDKEATIVVSAIAAYLEHKNFRVLSVKKLKTVAKLPESKKLANKSLRSFISRWIPNS